MAPFSGHLRLRASPRADGRTALSEQSFRAPFHIGKSYWDGSVLQVRIVNATAGILAGDQLELDAAVDPGASLLLTTPAAARAFVMRSGAAACRQRFAVADNGWLEYAPEPLFPHAETDYEQTTDLSLAPGAAACWVESLAPGRAGRGELWAWRRLRLTLTVTVGPAVVFRERLDCSGRELARQANFHSAGEAWFATAIYYSSALEGPAWAEAVRALHSATCAVAPTRLASSLWLVRLIGSSSLALRDALAALRAESARFLPALHSDLRRV